MNLNGRRFAAALTADEPRMGQSPPGEGERWWVRVGLLLDQIPLLPERARRPLWREAESVVRARARAAALVRARLDPEDEPARRAALRGRLSFFPLLRACLENVEDCGALEATDAILSSAQALCSDALETARCEATRARLAWKLGALDVADVRYRRVQRAARQLDSVELKVRAAIGFAILARLHGNYPRSRQLAARAARVAGDHGFMQLAALSHHTAMVADGIAGRFTESVLHGWLAYQYAEGDPRTRAELLGNLGQLFLDAGDLATATAAFVALLQLDPPERVRLPALGGLALAAARRGDEPGMRRALREIELSIEGATQPYELAVAQLDAAMAVVVRGDMRHAEDLLQQVSRAAAQHEYHELAYHADALHASLDRPATLAPPRAALAPRVAVVADSIRQLATSAA